MCEFTRQVRQVMRDHGVRSSDIWNNQYPNFTTVKCYVFEKARRDLLVEYLQRLCANTDAASVRVIAYEYRPDSVIVRIPKAR